MHANVADTGESVFLLLLPCISSGPLCAKKADFDAILHGRGPVGAVEAIFMITRRQDSPERHSHFFWRP